LSILYAPLCTRLDLYKIAFLITIAVTSTIPWDSYLIRNSIWSYPENVVMGPKILDIPIEEVFFFVIQTFNTTLLYLILNKPTLHSIYLVREKKGSQWKVLQVGGQLVLGLVIKKSFDWVKTPGQYTYMGLILVWACPFLLLLWSLAYQLLVRLPFSNTALPIAIPTLYLWAVDSLALQRGTWVISSATKTGVYLPIFGLELEEAVFFFLTNCLIVFGLVAFDNAVAVLNTFPAHFPKVPELPTPALLVRALLVPAAAYDDDRILGLRQSVQRLKNKSRSFYLASGTFSGRLRIDLIHLYSFCRVADDLIDNAQSPAEAKLWVLKLRKFLEFAYGGGTKSADGTVTSATDINQGAATLFAMNNFPQDTQLSLLYLPTQRMDKEPLFDLLKGFEMDLLFTKDANSTPIKSEPDLDTYGARVAGTVAHLCIQLVLFHYPGLSEQTAKRVMAAGHDMGIALQYTNIARDLRVDAENGRCYVPTSWLKREKMTPESFLSALRSHKNEDYVNKRIEKLRGHLLDRAFSLYEKSRGAIEELPKPARASMRVAVESYMQIGRELKTPGYVVKAGRATVPAWKRVVVAWTALNGPMPRAV
jgi:15-cis-phytoene synthase/lycopene beta-cyclase